MKFEETPIGHPYECPICGARCHEVGFAVTDDGGTRFCSTSCLMAADYDMDGGDDYHEPTHECKECGAAIYDDEVWGEEDEILCDQCDWWRGH